MNKPDLLCSCLWHYSLMRCSIIHDIIRSDSNFCATIMMGMGMGMGIGTMGMVGMVGMVVWRW